MNNPTISAMTRVWALFDTDPIIHQLKAASPDRHESIVNSLCECLVQADSLTIPTQDN